MTLNEFKAWLEGFTDGICGAPTDAQWTKIKKRLEQIDEKPTERVTFFDRYYPQWRSQPSVLEPANPWPNQTLYGGYGGTTGGEGKMTGVGFYSGEGAIGLIGSNLACGWASPAMQHSNLPKSDLDNFNSLEAFAALGHADYEELKNKQAA